MFSLASVATMAACIFMFGLFYIIVTNFSATVHSIEEGVSVTVFFENDATDAQIRDIGEKINKRAEVSKNEYVSADEAWKEYKKVYFQGKEELADGFTDNPLANSAHYQVYLNDVSMQDSLVTLSLIHISEPTRRTPISYAVFCLKKKKHKKKKTTKTTTTPHRDKQRRAHGYTAHPNAIAIRIT